MFPYEQAAHKSTSDIWETLMDQHRNRANPQHHQLHLENRNMFAKPKMEDNSEFQKIPSKIDICTGLL